MSPPLPLQWTESEKRLTFRMWGDGCSAGVISKRINRTRSAVMGFIHRHRAELPHHETRKSVEPRAPVRRSPRLVPLTPKTTKVRIMEKLACVGEDIPAPLNVPLLQANHTHCRYVTGRGPDGLAAFCGHEAVTSLSWCPWHLRRVSPSYVVQERAA